MTRAGPAIPVVVSNQPPDGGPALRVAVVSDGRAVEAGPARPVVVVSDNRPTQGNDPVPVVASSGNGYTLAGPPIPVVVVSGSLASNMAYTNKIIALGPIAYWPQAEASGTIVTDESGNGRNGAYKAAGEPLLGQTGIGDGRTAPLYDGVNDFANVFSASLQGAFNGAEGTIAIWFKVASAGVWTDATIRRLMYFQVDANNRARFEKSTTNNQIAAVYTAGGTAKSVLWNNAGPLTWQHLAITWSKSADQMKFYANGAQIGSTQTGLGTWAGNLASGNTVIGASDSSSGGTPWSGYLAHAAVWNTALSVAQIATLAVVP